MSSYWVEGVVGVAEGEAVGLTVGLGEAVGEGLAVAPFLRPVTIRTSTL